MRSQLTLKGQHVAYVAGELHKKLVKTHPKDPLKNKYEDDVEGTLKHFKKLLPDSEFDGVSIVDEEAEAEKQAEAQKAAEDTQKKYLESDEYKRHVAFAEHKRKKAQEERELFASTQEGETNADVAFKKLINSYSIKASYPAKQKAMDKAVEKLTVNGSVSDLYSVAVASIG